MATGLPVKSPRPTEAAVCGNAAGWYSTFLNSHFSLSPITQSHGRFSDGQLAREEVGVVPVVEGKRNVNGRRKL